MSNPILQKISEIFFSLCWSRTTTACTVESASLIIFSLALLVFGLLAIIIGRVKIGQNKLEGGVVRFLGVLLLLGAGLIFLQKTGLLIQLVLGLVVLIGGYALMEKPVKQKHLPTETHTFQSGPDEPAYRLHLRLMKDGTGILISGFNPRVKSPWFVRSIC